MADVNEPTAGLFRIYFELDELENVPPWGQPGEHKLHWYGLTSGRFWIDTPVRQALEYTSEIQRSWSLRSKNPDYFVARFFEDLLSILPLVREEVPSDLAARVANPSWRMNAERWRDALENDLGWDRWYAATQWWHDRTLDLGYLQHPPELAFWRTSDQVFFQLCAFGKVDGIPVWNMPEGQISVSADAFESEGFRFSQELLSCMDVRLHSIRQCGWQRADCFLDVEELVKEQATRRELVYKNSNERQTTD